jgi:hypothetical protein
MGALLADKKTVAATDFASSYAANADLKALLEDVVNKYPELADRLPKLSQQYRTHMFLIGSGVFQSIPNPSDEVMLIWETHLSNSDEYTNFCNNLCGSYIQSISYSK